ncbi:protein YqeH [Porphyridium purpureum]|uniref:Protein YqeH n=1 Tax=Porphyridium purpureum TaxID=35688 RepID=A0A5J4Z4F3_PORPP|nr:protein YqeH [Porphyridium purpureum]|eukprot:POR7228..scf295_1
MNALLRTSFRRGGRALAAAPARCPATQALVFESRRLFSADQRPWAVARSGGGKGSSKNNKGSHSDDDAGAQVDTDLSSEPAKEKSRFPTQGGPSKYGVKPSALGRVALIERTRSKAKDGRLCRGCGAEVRADMGNREAEPTEVMGGAKVTEDASRRRNKKMRWTNILETKKSFLCQRCRALEQGDVFHARDALRDVTPDVFKGQLKHIVTRRRFSLCVKVVDAADFEGSIVPSLRDCIGGTPVILAVNKCDLMPRMDDYDMRYLKWRASQRKINVISAHAVSAMTGYGVIGLAETILRELGGKDIFVVGAANVGKSTLVRALAQLLGKHVVAAGRAPRSWERKRREKLEDLDPTTLTASHLPGTTLQALRVPCFPSDLHALWDTPGIINVHSLAYYLLPSHFMEPICRPKRVPLRPVITVGTGMSVLIEAGWMRPDFQDDMDTDADAQAAAAAAKAAGAMLEANADIGTSAMMALDTAPAVLARLDIVHTELRFAEVRAFLMPGLDVRVVPTVRAPDVCVLPQQFVSKILKRMDRKLQEMSVPEFPFESYKVQEWEPDPHAQGGMSGLEIFFYNLGFLSVFSRGAVKVDPRCVKGSHWVKRRPMYPRNLEQRLQEAFDPPPQQSMEEFGGGMNRNMGEFLDDHEDQNAWRGAGRGGRHRGLESGNLIDLGNGEGSQYLEYDRRRRSRTLDEGKDSLSARDKHHYDHTLHDNHNEMDLREVRRRLRQALEEGRHVSNKRKELREMHAAAGEEFEEYESMQDPY